MAVFINKTPRKVQFVGYRADGLHFYQQSPLIYPGYARYIKKHYCGDYPIYIVVAYMSGANVQPRLDITQSSAGSVGVGFEYKNLIINNLGLKLNAGVNFTSYFSTGLAATKTGFNGVWTLYEQGSKWCFIPGGKCTKNMLRGW